MRFFARVLFLMLTFFLIMIAPAKTEWREEIGVFRIGIVNQDRGQGSLLGHEPFKVAISDALDMEVEFFQASGTNALIDALASGRIEYALMSSMGFALGWTVCECVEPLVLPRAGDSTDSYRLVAIARSNKGLALEKLANYKIAFASGEAVSGKPFVKYLLKQQNPAIVLDDVQDRRSANTGDLSEDLRTGEIDVLFGWSSMTGFPKEGYSRGTLRQLLAGKSKSPDFSILWQSEPIAHRPHVIRKNLPGELKSILARVLVGMAESNPLAYDSIEPVYAGGFVTTTREKYTPLINFLSNLKQTRALPEVTPKKDTDEKTRGGDEPGSPPG